jgi:anti-anti-sigma factor
MIHGLGAATLTLMFGTHRQSDGSGGHDRLQIRSVARADGIELRLSGELTLATVNVFQEQLHDSEAAGPDVLVIDLRQLRFVDSLAIGELIAADTRSRDAGRRLMLITAPGPVERLLALTGVDGRLRTASKPPEITEPERDLGHE